MNHSKPIIVFRLVGVCLFCALLALSNLGMQTGVGLAKQGEQPTPATLRYIADYGSDAEENNCLNQAAPCLTVQHAISVSGAGDTLRVTQGTYLENLHIDRPVRIEGGFQDNTWNRDIALYETVIDGSNSRAIPGDWDGDRVSSPTVIAVPGGYRMWYDGWGQLTDGATGLADSTDGISWTKSNYNPVLAPAGGDTAWDNWFRGQVSVLLDDGMYKMWYSGAGIPWQTGYATSSNGVNWSIYISNPVLPVGPAGSWDDQEADGPSVILDNGMYKMWYHGCNLNYSVCSIGYATSPDGITWTKHAGNPVLTSTTGQWDEGTLGWPRVIKKGSNTYEMWYFSNGQVGRATSSDGVSWTKYGGNPVIASDWEGRQVRNGSVVFDGSLYRMWFRSDDNWNSRIGLATSPNGIDWTMEPSNPVLWRGTPSFLGNSTVTVLAGVSGSSLDGLSITGAESCADGAGGVSVNGGVTTISYSKIYGNHAAYGCGGGGVGAMGGEADLILEFNQIYNNQANDGGGVMSWNGANITMRNTDVYNNTSYGWGGGGVEVMQNGARLLVEYSYIHDNDSGSASGGGVFAQEFASFVINNSKVNNNHSGNNGGGFYINIGQATGDNLEILGNTTKGNGGGVWVEGGASFELKHAMVRYNTSQQQGGGLGHYGDLTLLDSQVLENTAYDGAGGIAVFDPHGGGAFTAINTVIAKNQGTWGGGIAPFWRGMLVNVTVANNTCSECGNAGIEAGSDSVNSPRVLINTIVFFNNTGSFACDGNCTVSYSDIQGGWPGTGNFSAPPMFTDTGSLDYRLSGYSPCIDTGTASQAPDHDLEGEPRPINHGFDVGADEYNAPYGSGPAVLRLEPTGTTQYVGQPFQVKIQVDAGGQVVDGVEAHLDFDPAVFQVTSVAAGTALPLILHNAYDNTSGTIDFAAGALSNFPSGTFTVATITLNPVTVTNNTWITFYPLKPRQSDVVFSGNSVLDHLELQMYAVRDDATIAGAISLQGRLPAPNARWITPLTVKLTPVGQTTPIYVLNPTTDNTGHFTLEGITPGSYTIVVKNNHTLANTKTATLAFGTNVLNFGTLREGDADNNNCVAMVDFSILATTFLKVPGNPGYDDRADFNEDAIVNISDFSLLSSNFGVCGDLPAAPVPISPSRSASPTPVDVAIVLQPETYTGKVGETFTLNIEVQSGAQSVDGAEAHLDFNPDLVKVKQIIGNTTAFPMVLENTYNNTLGTLDYAAGTFSGFPNGTTIVAMVEFIALKETTLTNLPFVFQAPRLTDVTYGGQSILTQHQDGALTILPGQLKVLLPLVLR